MTTFMVQVFVTKSKHWADWIVTAKSKAKAIAKAKTRFPSGKIFIANELGV